MRLLYLFSVWLHILAATVWIGGMAFLVLVVVPWLRRGNPGNAATLLRDTGKRFRTVGWICFCILLLTGSFNLWMRGVRLADFFRADWQSSPFGKAVLLKLALFGVVLLLSAVHDFIVGPRATAAIEHAPRSAEAQAWRRKASRLGRANALLALLLVAVAVTLVRGMPW
jgi:copper resistance protein D